MKTRLLCVTFLAACSAIAAPALLPLPRQVEWQAGEAITSAAAIALPSTPSPEIAFVGSELSNTLTTAGARIDATATFRVTLALAPVPDARTTDEAYRLIVAPDGIELIAPTREGLVWGLQTLRQLARAEGGRMHVPCCSITDWPAFAWRGFMHDLGRNPQSVATLKRFIDTMARYKMNVFHMHLTDDPGYRIESKIHPELNRASNMRATRQPGFFYTFNELNDLIRYAALRGIRVVPEIDLPGHSEYFKNTYGFDMQDPRGMKILGELLNEFMDHVDTKELHIGSDEVGVRNASFMPAMTDLVRKRGRTVLVWRPGYQPAGRIITQLWSAGAKPSGPLPGIPALDSRQDYINHMDPFDGTVRELNLATCDKAEGDDCALGGILCHWPDLNTGGETNVYRTNPVFPALLAAAERYWRGHTTTEPKWWGRLPPADSPAFASYADFENRMIARRDSGDFADWNFPYVRQTQIPWKLIGPFDHKGDASAVFPPEKEIRDTYEVDGKSYTWTEARGATIHINHFWYDGWLPKTKQGTVYAMTQVWSPDARTVGFWIGFNGPSRSDRRAGPNPAIGQWSTSGSKIWVNGSEVPPPAWKQPGALRDPKEMPFVDEDYFYREPTQIALKAGWNRILVKAPKTTNGWKWMFTCVPVAGTSEHPREVPDLRFSTEGKP